MKSLFVVKLCKASCIKVIKKKKGGVEYGDGWKPSLQLQHRGALSVCVHPGCVLAGLCVHSARSSHLSPPEIAGLCGPGVPWHVGCMCRVRVRSVSLAELAGSTDSCLKSSVVLTGSASPSVSSAAGLDTVLKAKFLLAD